MLSTSYLPWLTSFVPDKKCPTRERSNPIIIRAGTSRRPSLTSVCQSLAWAPDGPRATGQSESASASASRRSLTFGPDSRSEPASTSLVVPRAFGGSSPVNAPPRPHCPPLKSLTSSHEASAQYSAELATELTSLADAAGLPRPTGRLRLSEAEKLRGLRCGRGRSALTLYPPVRADPSLILCSFKSPQLVIGSHHERVADVVAACQGHGRPEQSVRTKLRSARGQPPSAPGQHACVGHSRRD